MKGTDSNSLGCLYGCSFPSPELTNVFVPASVQIKLGDSIFGPSQNHALDPLNVGSHSNGDASIDRP
jgi:hypothetical protein